VIRARPAAERFDEIVVTALLRGILSAGIEVARRPRDQRAAEIATEAIRFSRPLGAEAMRPVPSGD
jgi:hypothetical protein